MSFSDGTTDILLLNIEKSTTRTTFVFITGEVRESVKGNVQMELHCKDLTKQKNKVENRYKMVTSHSLLAGHMQWRIRFLVQTAIFPVRL